MSSTPLPGEINALAKQIKKNRDKRFAHRNKTLHYDLGKHLTNINHPLANLFTEMADMWAHIDLPFRSSKWFNSMIDSLCHNHLVYIDPPIEEWYTFTNPKHTHTLPGIIKALAQQIKKNRDGYIDRNKTLHRDLSNHLTAINHPAANLFTEMSNAWMAEQPIVEQRVFEDLPAECDKWFNSMIDTLCDDHEAYIELPIDEWNTYRGL